MTKRIRLMATHNDFGKWGERKAEEYLVKKGYSICHRNWKTGHRDLDITAITPDGETLAIVEVKTRHNTDMLDAEEAVDWRKMRNLMFGAIRCFAMSVSTSLPWSATTMMLASPILKMHLSHDKSWIL